MVETVEKSLIPDLSDIENPENSLESIVNIENISENPNDLSDKIPAVVTYMHWYFPSCYILPDNDIDLVKFAEKLKNKLGQGYRKNNRRIMKIMREIRPKLTERITRDFQIWPHLTEYEKHEMENMEMEEYRDVKMKLMRKGLGPVLRQIETWYQIVCNNYVNNLYGHTFSDAIERTFCEGKNDEKKDE